MRSNFSLILTCTAAWACGSGPGQGRNNQDSGDSLAPPVFCDGATGHRWDPAGAVEVELFPDGLLQVTDPTSPTGLRLDVSVARAPWIDDAPPLLADALTNLADLSGFGTLGGGMLRFDGPVTGLPATAEQSMSDTGWMLVDLDASPPERVPFEVRVVDEDQTVLLWPLRPLRMATRHALVVTTDAIAADGGCIAPADATRTLLYGDVEDEILAEAAPSYRDAVATLGLVPDDISALSVFTTHADVDVVRDVAAAEATQPVSWTSDLDCSDRGDVLACATTMTVRDHRNVDGLVDPDVEPVEAEIPVSVWVPDLDGGPYPVVIYGHGLGSTASEGYRTAEAMGDVGYIVVSMDAVEHGAHPTAGGGSSTDDAMRFLGIDMSTVTIRPRAIRGNFDQTVLDRLRLIRLLREQPDLDGDGHDDVDVDKMAYLGVSLGAILGPQLLALEPELQGAVLSVGGARLMSIVTDSGTLGGYEDILYSLVGSEERFDRLVTVAQHIVDPVDPGTWAAHVLTDRFDDGNAPSLLVQVGMFDEVVPPSSGHALARALDVAHMEPVAVDVSLLEITDDDPVVANFPDGATAALFQFDQVTRDGVVGPARHVATPTSVEGSLQIQTFLETWAATGEAEIINPYAAR